MASLAICAFLYASLIDDHAEPGSGVGGVDVLWHRVGCLRAVVVYSVALMLFEHPGTRRAAEGAYWVPVIAGPMVSIRFVAASANEGWLAHHTRGTAWCSPLWVGMVIAVVPAVLGYRAAAGGVPDHGLGGLRDRLRDRPTAPAFGAFLFAAATGFLSAQTDFHPSELLAWFA